LAKALDDRLTVLSDNIAALRLENAKLQEDWRNVTTAFERRGFSTFRTGISQRIGQLLEFESTIVSLIGKETSRAYPSAVVAVEDLFAVLNSERALNKQAGEWSSRLSDALGIPASGGAAERFQIVLAEQGQLRFALRLSIIAALDVWQRVDWSTLKESHSDLLNELRLETLQPSLKSLLQWPPSQTDDQFLAWIKQGFYEGGWLHQLFRADAILSTFFASDAALGSVQIAVSLTASAIRASGYHFGIEIRRVPLLMPPPEGVQPYLHGPGGLPKIGTVRKAVLARLQGAGGERFVVDVPAWGFQTRAGGGYPGMVALCNPSDWQRAELTEG
jgi:hypothetical protein